MFEKLKKNRLQQILTAHEGQITGLVDLIADQEPSFLFYLLGMRYSKLMQNNIDEENLKKAIIKRRKINPFLKKGIPMFMKEKQIFENRRALRGESGPDTEPLLPDEPVIWASNHLFKDDAGGSIMAAKRHVYILFGSISQLYNTVDGIFAYLNGIVVINRKVKASRNSSVNKAVAVLRQGTDLLIYPEGVWNKTPEKLLLDFWPGIYRISRETGARVVPIIHYIKDPTNHSSNNEIHTVVDDAVKIDDMSERAALEYLREIMGTWYYLMMEKYGKSTRKIETDGFPNSSLAWEYNLAERVKPVGRYDKEIEFYADYQPKEYIKPLTIWKELAAIRHISFENAAQVADACRRLEQLQKEDFQHRF